MVDLSSQAALRRPALVLAALLGLSACASAPVGVMGPIGATAEGATTLSMLVATTRAPSDNPGVLYTGERGPLVDLSDITLSIPSDAVRTVGEVQWPKKLPPDPAKEFATVSVERVGDGSKTDAWLAGAGGTSRQLLVFVHGFNNVYERAVYRFAQIAHDSGTAATPLLFTWPSRGSVFAYGYDKESTNYSRTALEYVMAEAAESSRYDEITVLAHSMGTWLTVESLRQMAIRQGRIPAKISNVILAAPDLDFDVFRQQLADMGPDRPKFTVFVSRDDRALNVSRRISGNIDRLGQVDINDPAIREVLEAEGITVLDLSALRVGDRLNHSKFAESPEVVKLLGDRLIAGQTVTDQDVGLGAELGATALSVTNTVGSAAGLAVSVPIAILDPSTRENLDDQADRFGQSLGSTVEGLVPGANTTTRRCTSGRQDCPAAGGGR